MFSYQSVQGDAMQEQELDTLKITGERGVFNHKGFYYLTVTDKETKQVNKVNLGAMQARTQLDNNWKLHISVKPDDLEKAWGVLWPLLSKNENIENLSLFKITNQEYVKDSLDKLPKNTNKHEEASRVYEGAQITIYLPKKPDVEFYKKFTDEIKTTLEEAKVEPGTRPTSDGRFKDNPYLSTRNGSVVKSRLYKFEEISENANSPFDGLIENKYYNYKKETNQIKEVLKKLDPKLLEDSESITNIIQSQFQLLKLDENEIAKNIIFENLEDLLSYEVVEEIKEKMEENIKEKTLELRSPTQNQNLAPFVDRVHQLRDAYNKLESGTFSRKQHVMDIDFLITTIDGIMKDKTLSTEEKQKQMTETLGNAFNDAINPSKVYTISFNDAVNKLNNNPNHHHYARLLGLLYRDIGGASPSHLQARILDKLLIPQRGFFKKEINPAYKAFENPIFPKAEIPKREAKAEQIQQEKQEKKSFFGLGKRNS